MLQPWRPLWSTRAFPRPGWPSSALSCAEWAPPAFPPASPGGHTQPHMYTLLGLSFCPFPSRHPPGRSGLHQGEPNCLNSGQVGRPQAGEDANVLACFTQRCQAATLMLPRNIQASGHSHPITIGSEASGTLHARLSATCGLRLKEQGRQWRISNGWLTSLFLSSDSPTLWVYMAPRKADTLHAMALKSEYPELLMQKCGLHLS